MKHHSISAAVAAVALVAVISAPAWAGSGEKCSADAQACLNHMTQNKTSGWLGLEFDKDAEGVTKVKRVVAESPAEKAGFMTGDVIVAVNGAKTSDHAAMKKAKGAWKAGQEVTYTVERMGAEKNLAATLGSMPENVQATMIGYHMMENHMTAATTAAAEATPHKH